MLHCRRRRCRRRRHRRRYHRRRRRLLTHSLDAKESPQQRQRED